MRTLAKSLLAILSVGIAGALSNAGAQAQNMTLRGSNTVSLKNGKSEELGDFYYQRNCVSLLNKAPQVEVVQGPPGVTAELKEAMVLAREFKCPSSIKGFKLFVSAKNIEDPSYSQLILRITYDTREGERKQSEIINLYLVP
jgi:hypothetical protein